jgi:hypothetical protein
MVRRTVGSKWKKLRAKFGHKSGSRSQVVIEWHRCLFISASDAENKSVFGRPPSAICLRFRAALVYLSRVRALAHQLAADDQSDALDTDRAIYILRVENSRAEVGWKLHSVSTALDGSLINERMRRCYSRLELTA